MRGAQGDPDQEPAEEPPEKPSDGPSRTVVVTALVLSTLAVAVVLGIAATRRPPSGPVGIPAVPAPQAESPECRALLATLPDRLGDFRRETVAEPAPPGAAAWRAEGNPVILRCGLGRPAEFVVGSPIQQVNQVQWFRLDDADTGRSTWVSVDRPVYVALTLPTGSGPAPIQSLSGVIERSMPAIPIRPGPPG